MIFVMGGRGFVGSAFVRLMDRLGEAYEIIEVDNYADYRGRSCDILINANGNSKKWLANKEPVTEFDLSVRTVVDSLHAIEFGKYVLCSTCDVYNDCSDPSKNHEDVAIDRSRQSRYGFHKYVAEDFVRHEAERHLIVRFGGFVGPNLRKNAIYDILNGGPLWLDPESELQFLPTDTAAEIVYQLATSVDRNDVFNVCGNGLVKLRDVMDHLGTTVPVQEASPTVRYQVNVDKLLQHMDVPATKASVLEFVDQYERE